MKRTFGCLLIAGLLLGASACGSSGGGGGGSNAAVASYCKAVDVYVQDVKATMNDPAKAAALNTTATELAKKVQDLGTSKLSSDDAQKVADCSKRSSMVLTPKGTTPS